MRVSLLYLLLVCYFLKTVSIPSIKLCSNVKNTQKQQVHCVAIKMRSANNLVQTARELYSMGLQNATQLMLTAYSLESTYDRSCPSLGEVCVLGVSLIWPEISSLNDLENRFKVNLS